MYNIQEDIERHHRLNRSHTKKESVVNMLLGFWILILPLLVGNGFGRNSLNVISWNFTLTGLAVVILSFISLRFLKPWSLWLTFAAGGWILLSPLLLGYLGNTGLVLSSTILGFIIMANVARLIPTSERQFFSRVSTKDYHH